MGTRHAKQQQRTPLMMMMMMMMMVMMTQLTHPEIGNHRSFSWTSAAVSAAPVARDGYGGGGEGNDDMPSRVS
jgi:hypothetical protein